MFSNNLIGAMILAMSAATAATGASVPSSETPTAGRPGTCTLDTERYVQTELDWRSYYLNRPGAPRYSGQPGNDAYSQPWVGHGG